jgi:hypothetical protein
MPMLYYNQKEAKGKEVNKNNSRHKFFSKTYKKGLIFPYKRAILNVEIKKGSYSK